MVLENKSLELIEEVIKFCLSIGLPITLAEIGIEDLDEKISIIAKNSLDQILSEPSFLYESMLFDAIKMANALGKKYKSEVTP
ncbi:hypothetical protein [Clostridium sp.]|uniref:hypothetical protein n=1 Tax=Clostridium sp. TaxID=1506 RepID=UPI003D6D3066